MNQHHTKTQCFRLLKRLRKEPVTTVQARHEEDIFSPPARIWDLRHKYGFNVVTERTTAHNPGGKTHTVAKYVLLPGKYRGEK